MLSGNLLDVERACLRGSRLFDHLQTGTVLFPSLIDGYYRPAERSQLPQFLLDILKPFMPLSMRNLVERATALLAPILFILLVNLGNFRP